MVWKLSSSKIRKIKYIFLVTILAIFFFNNLACKKGEEEKTTKIGITQFTTHPALDKVRAGVIKEIQSNNENIEIDFIFRNANADFSAATKIAKEFSTLNLSMIIPITTVSAQPIAKIIKETPIVFAGVTDPVGAGLVNSIEEPGGNITGSSDLWPFMKQFDIFKKAFPSLTSIGYIYNPGETQAEFALQETIKGAQQHGLKIITKQIDSTNLIRSAAIQLNDQVDGFYFGMDNTIAQGIDILIRISRDLRKPLFAGDENTVAKGGTLSLGVDFEEVGRIAGRIAKKILFEEISPTDIPVQRIQEGQIFFNEESFILLNKKIPNFILKRGVNVTNSK
jgi:putative ABC transport system substrate-binding protein